MQLPDWISVFMAVIAVASAMVTYAVYRSSTDPTVIVYADPDLKRPSVVNLIIKNIGKGPAYDVIFKSSRPLPAEAFGIDIPVAVPKTMTEGPIVSGIPFLAPDQQIILTWGQYGGLYKYIEESSIRVEATFGRAPKSRFPFKRLKSVSALNIEMFKRSESSERGFGPDLVKELKAVNKTMIEIRTALQSR